MLAGTQTCFLLQSTIAFFALALDVIKEHHFSPSAPLKEILIEYFPLFLEVSYKRDVELLAGDADRQSAFSCLWLRNAFIPSALMLIIKAFKKSSIFPTTQAISAAWWFQYKSPISCLCRISIILIKGCWKFWQLHTYTPKGALLYLPINPPPHLWQMAGGEYVYPRQQIASRIFIPILNGILSWVRGGDGNQWALRSLLLEQICPFVKERCYDADHRSAAGRRLIARCRRIFSWHITQAFLLAPWQADRENRTALDKFSSHFVVRVAVGGDEVCVCTSPKVKGRGATIEANGGFRRQRQIPTCCSDDH